MHMKLIFILTSIVKCYVVRNKKCFLSILFIIKKLIRYFFLLQI